MSTACLQLVLLTPSGQKIKWGVLNSYKLFTIKVPRYLFQTFYYEAAKSGKCWVFTGSDSWERARWNTPKKADIWEYELRVWRDTQPQTTGREMNTHRLLRNSLSGFELSQPILEKVHLGCRSVQLSAVKLVTETQMGVVVGLWFYMRAWMSFFLALELVKVQCSAGIHGLQKSHFGSSKSASRHRLSL